MSLSPITSWLEEKLHDTVEQPETFVLSEVSPQSDELRTHLSQRLIEHRTALRVARDMTELLGWDAVRARLTPSLVQIRHGDFGEMLACEILAEFADLTIPVKKVRYQMHVDQTLVGADVVGLELDGDTVTCVHFAEAKLRTTGDTAAGDAAHEQLARWHGDEFGQILFFIGSRLEETDPELYSSFFEYLTDRAFRADHFHIVLVWEAARWTDTVLTNLPESPDVLDPLTVRVVLVEDLAGLTQTAYEGMATAVGE
jgi:HamA